MLFLKLKTEMKQIWEVKGDFEFLDFGLGQVKLGICQYPKMSKGV